MELSNRGILLIMFIGLLTASLSTFIMIFRPCETIASKNLKFFEGGYIFELWRKPPVDIFLKVYIFNVTNKEAFLNGTEKLEVQEVGPYVFRELLEHANTEFNDNGTVSGVPKHPLQFVSEMSVGTEDDIFLLPNVALLSLGDMVSKKNVLLKTGLNMLISQTDSLPIVQQTAREYLFDYSNPLVTLGNTLMPSWIKFEKIGVLDRMYDVEGDVFTTYTGETDPHLTGTFATYNRFSHLPQWPSAPCNKLDGASDGAKFPTKIKTNETLKFFRKAIGRTMPMIRTGALITTGEVDVAHYKFRDDAFHYGEGNEENRCFCSNNECLRNGLLDVSKSYYGFPIALSYPHFYTADPTIREETKGMNPDAALHETRFSINPQTGAVLSVSVKIQANLVLGDIRDISNCERFSNLVVPLIWIDLNVPKLTFFVKFVIFLMARVAPVADMIFSCLFLIFGGSFLIISIRAFINQTHEKKEIRKISQNHQEHADCKEYNEQGGKEKVLGNSGNGESARCFPLLSPINDRERDTVKIPLTSSISF